MIPVSTFFLDGHNDYVAGKPYSPPACPPCAEEYKKGWEDAKNHQERANERPKDA